MSTTKKRVAVIGLGTAGSMSAWRLAARGAEVVGYEQFGIAHDRSAHAGESRIFRTAYFEDPEYVPLLRTAKALWHQLEGETGTHLLTLAGNLMLGDASTQMANVSDSIDKFGVDASLIPMEGARNLWPHHPFHEGDVIVLDREAGYLRPELAVLQAAYRARSLGAQLRTYTPVDGIEIKDDGGVWVSAAGQSERYDHVVVTTGPWAAKLLPELGALVEVRKAVSAWFVAKERGAFEPANFPCFIRTAPEEYYGLPAMEGNGLKLGLSGTVNRPVPDPDALDRTVPLDEVQGFRELVAESFPALYPDPVRVAAYMEGYTQDGHGIVGRPGGEERLTVVTGLSGHGFKLAPALGEIAADYALDGSSDKTIPQLNPDRFLTVPTSTANP